MTGSQELTLIRAHSDASLLWQSGPPQVEHHRMRLPTGMQDNTYFPTETTFSRNFFQHKGQPRKRSLSGDVATYGDHQGRWLPCQTWKLCFWHVSVSEDYSSGLQSPEICNYWRHIPRHHTCMVKRRKWDHSFVAQNEPMAPCAPAWRSTFPCLDCLAKQLVGTLRFLDNKNRRTSSCCSDRNLNAATHKKIFLLSKILSETCLAFQTCLYWGNKYTSVFLLSASCVLSLTRRISRLWLWCRQHHSTAVTCTNISCSFAARNETNGLSFN